MAFKVFIHAYESLTKSAPAKTEYGQNATTYSKNENFQPN